MPARQATTTHSRAARRSGGRLLAAGAFVLLVAAAPQDRSAGGAANGIQDGARVVAQTNNPAIDWSRHPGRTIFETHCAACHEGAVPNAPNRTFLETLSPTAILAAMDGVMRMQAARLDPPQRRAVAEWLTQTDLARVTKEPGAVHCPAARPLDEAGDVAANGWGYDNRRFAGADAGIAAGDLGHLVLRWAFAFPYATRARSQPVFAMGAIFVGSQDGTVYALDSRTGCAFWTFPAGAEVRTAIVVAPAARGSHKPRRAFFGDLLGRVYALDATSGRLLWRTRPDEHPALTITGTPSIVGHRLIVALSSLEPMSAGDPDYDCCSFSGAVAALDMATGKTEWIHRTITTAAERRSNGKGKMVLGPSGAPVWNSPTIDLRRQAVYFGTGENYSSPADGNSDGVIAVDLETGKRLWTRQLTTGDAWNIACMVGAGANCPAEKGPDHDIGASVMLVDVAPGRQLLIAGDKSGWVTALDPDHQGQVVWRVQAGRGSVVGGIHFGMAAEGPRLYVPINDRDATSLGTRPEGPGRPGLMALDARDGRTLWRVALPGRCASGGACAPAGISAAVTAIPGAVIAGSTDGMLRGFEGATGKVLWEVDTTLPRQAVNGGVAHGGAMSGPGAMVADGMVAVNSGYGLSGQTPGNALLVFSPARR